MPRSEYGFGTCSSRLILEMQDIRCTQQNLDQWLCLQANESHDSRCKELASIQTMAPIT